MSLGIQGVGSNSSLIWQQKNQSSQELGILSTNASLLSVGASTNDADQEKKGKL